MLQKLFFIVILLIHLLTSSLPLTPSQLDDRIESWMEQKFGTAIDFDIEKPLQNLAEIKAKIESTEANNYAVKQVALLKRDRQNRCQVLSLPEAKGIIDYVWDHLFSYPLK